MAGIKGRSGGKRPGSGRKPKEPKEFCEELKERVLLAVKNIEKDLGCSYEEAVLRKSVKEDCPPQATATIFRTYCELFSKKETKNEDEDKDTRPRGPMIYLPAITEEDPALKVVSDKPKNFKEN